MLGIDADVIVAGGGLAGLAAAAALGEFGWSVVVVEPGQHAERRLAGELLHPPGVAGLVELGLYDAPSFANAVPVDGFYVLRDDGLAGVPLPYDNAHDARRHGLALEHGAIRAALRAAAARLPHVRLWDGARVVGVEAHRGGGTPRVSISRGGGAVVSLRCRMIVGADGVGSRVRALAGITHRRRRLSNIIGYLICRDALPAPGFGHLCLSRGAPMLAYEIDGGRARVLFDRALTSQEPPGEDRQRAMMTLPPPLRAELTAAVEQQRGLSSVSTDVTVEAAGRGPVVLVGDAGGSCHPLTATGMSVGIGDALRLRQALRDCDGAIEHAIALYAKRRRVPQRARLLLASVLHELFARQDQAARALRDVVIDYWENDTDGRKNAVALLTMADARVVTILRQMAAILLFGTARASRQRGVLCDALPVGAQLGTTLSGLLLRHGPRVMMRAR